MARLKEKPITWRESPRFARAFERSRGARLLTASAYLRRFLLTAAITLASKVALDLPARVQNGFPIRQDDLILASFVATIATLAYWVLTHAYGGVRMEDAGITLVRLAGSPKSPWVLHWRWEAIDEVACEVMTIEGRAYDVLVVRTTDGARHPIGLDRRVDRAAILARAERAGLVAGQEDDGRTTADVLGSVGGDLAGLTRPEAGG